MVMNTSKMQLGLKKKQTN